MALAITRRVGESLLIGDNIRITIVTFRGREIRLAIEAPRDIHIVREEIANKPKSEPVKGWPEYER